MSWRWPQTRFWLCSSSVDERLLRSDGVTYDVGHEGIVTASGKRRNIEGVGKDLVSGAWIGMAFYDMHSLETQEALHRGKKKLWERRKATLALTHRLESLWCRIARNGEI